MSQEKLLKFFRLHGSSVSSFLFLFFNCRIREFFFKCCFTSTETTRTGSKGRPPPLSQNHTAPELCISESTSNKRMIIKSVEKLPTRQKSTTIQLSVVFFSNLSRNYPSVQCRVHVPRIKGGQRQAVLPCTWSLLDNHGSVTTAWLITLKDLDSALAPWPHTQDGTRRHFPPSSVPWWDGAPRDACYIIYAGHGVSARQKMATCAHK